MAITFLLLFIGAIILGFILGKKDNKIKKLEEENKELKDKVNLFSRIVREANIKNIAPKNLNDNE